MRRGDASAAELRDIAVARVEGRNPELNAVVSRLYDQARATVAAGLPDGPFTGVPYLLKDLGAHYAGAVTSYGSALFRDFLVDHDSEITVRLRRSGLVIFGKTNIPEMGLAASTEPRLFGPTRNPWSLAHSAGGSSGGSAAAVAAGIVPMAHATDGWGDPDPGLLLRPLRPQTDPRAQPHGAGRRRRMGRHAGLWSAPAVGRIALA